MTIHYSSEDAGYIATDPLWPGLSAFGDTEDEARAEWAIVVALAREVYATEGWSLPE